MLCFRYEQHYIGEPFKGFRGSSLQPITKERTNTNILCQNIVVIKLVLLENVTLMHCYPYILGYNLRPKLISATINYEQAIFKIIELIVLLLA